MKAKDMAVDPGNASTSESNSDAQASRSQELQPPRRFSYELTRCMSSGVDFMDLTRTIGSRRSESCRLATPKRRAKAGDRRVQRGREHCRQNSQTGHLSECARCFMLRAQ